MDITKLYLYSSIILLILVSSLLISEIVSNILVGDNVIAGYLLLGLALSILIPLYALKFFDYQKKI